MDEIIKIYREGKYHECLKLIESYPKTRDMIDGFLMENCSLVCESIINTLDKNPDRIYETQERLYMFFDKVTSIDLINPLPFQLKLTVSFNYFWWLLFCSDNDLTDRETDEYLRIVNKGLSRVLGTTFLSNSGFDLVDNILHNLLTFKHIITEKEHKTVYLILELVVVVILLMLKLKKSSTKKFLEVINVFIINLKNTIESLKCTDKFFKVNSESLCLFKFGLSSIGTSFSELSDNILDYLYILEAAFLYSSHEFSASLKSLCENQTCNTSGLWHYLGVLNSFNLMNWNLCFGFLTKGYRYIHQSELKAKFYIMHGKLHCSKKNHKEAIKYFLDAKNISPENPAIYFYLGQEYGRIGLYDLMSENFEELVKVIRQQEFCKHSKLNYEKMILDCIHPLDEIKEVEALYALAVSYGLNEGFRKAADTFEEILRFPNIDTVSDGNRIIRLPNFLTVLHEASIMNLLTGNLARAEQIALDAADKYVPRESSHETNDVGGLRLRKDVNWLKVTVERELLESDLQPEEIQSDVFYAEDLIYFLPQNVMALLIVSEIERIQGIEDYSTTSNKILSLFSRYLASVQNKRLTCENEKRVWTLIKALAGKTCLRIAKFQSKQKDVESIEKMFKRALSCNKGDKDVLFYYYEFLSAVGKNRDAVKLWHTFQNEKTTVSEDSLQSFSLRYFLGEKVTGRELEKIRKSLETLEIDI